MPRYARPSQYRFLAPLLVTVIAMAFLLGMQKMEGFLCKFQPAADGCRPVLPLWFELGVLGVAVLGILASIHKYWVDFHRGEYYLDLEDPRWRDR